jgi:hypothetical protein
MASTARLNLTITTHLDVDMITDIIDWINGGYGTWHEAGETTVSGVDWSGDPYSALTIELGDRAWDALAAENRLYPDWK